MRTTQLSFRASAHTGVGIYSEICVFEIATPVCALVRNDNEEKRQLDKPEFEEQ